MLASGCIANEGNNLQKATLYVLIMLHAVIRALAMLALCHEVAMMSSSIGLVSIKLQGPSFTWHLLGIYLLWAFTWWVFPKDNKGLVHESHFEGRTQ